MTPHFALSLSIDGIVLLHRVAEGWHRIGEVDVASETLNADMAALLDDAKAREDGDLRTKLILPNDQIRFMAIETAITSTADIQSAVSAATPLALDEIEIDYDRNGGRTYIAAVAKQTLLEAETFAREHGFEPVCFVAAAEPYTFSGEVFFGPTAYATEKLGLADSIAREDKPPIETLASAPAAAPLKDETEAVDPVREEDKSAAPVKAPNNADDETEEPSTTPVFSRRNRDTAAAPAADTPIAKFNRSGSTKKTTTPVTAPPAPLPDNVSGLSASRPATTEPVAPVKPAAKKLENSKGTKRLSGLLASKPAEPTAPETTATDIALAQGIAKSHVTQGKPKYLGLILTAALIATMGLVAMWANRQVDGGVAGLLEVDPGLQEDTAPVIAAPVAAPEPAAQEPVTAAVAPEPAAPAPAAEEETPPTPIVTAVPGRVLSPADAARIYAATGVWQRAPRLPGQPSEAEQTTLDSLHSFADLETVERLDQFAGPSLIPLTHELPILTPQDPIPFGREIARDEDGFIRASASGTVLPTGLRIYGRAPARRPPLRPGPEGTGLDDASLPDLLDDMVTELQFVAYTSGSDLPPPRAFRAPALSQPMRLLEPIDEQTTGMAGAKFVSAPPPVEATDPAAVPDVAEDAVEDTANEEPTLAAGAVPAPETAEVETDAAAEPDTFVEVIQGRPAIVPPLRPGSAEAIAEIAPQTDSLETTEPPLFQDPRLVGFRPSARPDALVPASAVTFEAIPELAGIRPSLRPAALVPEEVSAPVASDPAIENTNDISSIVATIAAAAPPSQIINPTPRAIALSPRPDPRPTNFARVVASAQALQQRQESRNAAASTAAAVIQQQPSAPASAPATGGQTSVTVSRAATVDGVIRLRDMNLIGVYGKPGARRALVRMPNGRFVKVEVGSTLDGGRVTAIGDSALNFVKRGQTYALQLPAG